MSDATKRPIPSDAGAFISLEEMNLLTKNHDDDHASASAHQKTLNPHIKAICFGKDKVLELLDQPGATALRIYFGLKIDTDGDGIKEKKMVLVAVDEEGDDIVPIPQDAAALSSGIQAKSMQAKILDAGLPCPSYCAGKKP